MFDRIIRDQALEAAPDRQSFLSIALRLSGAIGAVGLVGGSSIFALMLLGKAMAWAAVAIFGPVVALEIVALPLLRKKVRNSPLLRSLVDGLQVVAIYTLPLQATFFTTMAFVAVAMITGSGTSSTAPAAYTYEFVSFSVLVFLFLFGFGGLGLAGVEYVQHDGPNLRIVYRVLGWTFILLSIAVLYPGLVWTNHWLESLGKTAGPWKASLLVFGGLALASVLLAGLFFSSVTPAVSDLAFYGPSGLVAIARKGRTSIWSLDGNKTNELAMGKNVVVFNQDGTLLAGDDRNDHIWIRDVATGKVVAHLPGLKNHAADLAFSPDSQRIATLDEDGWIQVWSLSEGRLEWEQDCGKTVNDPISLAFDPSGVTVLVGTGQAKLARFETSGGQVLGATTDFEKDFSHENFAKVRISPTGRSVVVEDTSTATTYVFQGGALTRVITGASLDGTVIVTSACDDAAQTLAVGNNERCRVFFHNESAMDLDQGLVKLAIDQMGRRLVTATKKHIIVWDIETKEKTQLL